MKLPNLWVERPETLGSGGLYTSSIHSFGNAASPTAALYIPAARVRELVEKWRRKADVNAPASIERSAAWDSAANQLEAIIREPGE